MKITAHLSWIEIRNNFILIYRFGTLSLIKMHYFSFISVQIVNLNNTNHEKITDAILKCYYTHRMQHRG